MKVSQLIEALTHMPADAEVLTHVYQTAGTGETMRVGLVRTEDGSYSFCIIGTWGADDISDWRYGCHGIARTHSPMAPMASPVYVTRGSGELATEAIRQVPCPYSDVDETTEALMTPEEEDAENMRIATEKAAREESERRELERLKAKYEKPR